jgi:hypothetical protein
MSADMRANARDSTRRRFSIVLSCEVRIEWRNIYTHKYLDENLHN